jgi:uncharacterized FlgJ-related protein
MDYRTKYHVARKLLFMTLIGITAYFVLKNTMFKQPIPEIRKPSIIVDTVRIETFSEANLIRYMDILEIEYPNIVLAQAKLESGNFTSNRFKQYNALFGFQTSNTNVLKYKSWKESVINYKNWQMRRLKDGENYYDFLVRVKYSEDPNYINKLKQF